MLKVYHLLQRGGVQNVLMHCCMNHLPAGGCSVSGDDDDRSEAEAASGEHGRDDTQVRAYLLESRWVATCIRRSRAVCL